jgi:hypothetical protein
VTIGNSLLRFNITVELADAIRLQTRQALFFVRKAAAWVTTGMRFCTTAVHLGQALRFAAYIFEGRNYARRGDTFYHFKAKATFPRIFVLLCIFACLADMIGSTIADSAEVFGAITAPHSECCHVLSCLFGNWIT